MLQAYEGYLEKGRFFPIGTPMSTQGRCRVIVTILEETTQETVRKDDRAWLDDFHRLAIDSANEVLRDEDFPRLSLGRELLAIDEQKG